MDEDREHISQLIEANRKLAAERSFPSVKRRRMLLKRMLKLLLSHKHVAIDALREDLGKSEFESMMTEILPLSSILKYLIRKLPSLAAPERVGCSIMNFPARGRLMKEPYGQVLIGATWNYPLLLALEPVAGAVAAGNYAVLKLAGRAPHTTQFVCWLIEEAFQGEVVAVDDEMSWQELLQQNFDHIFYTGSSYGGREVLRAAAENLTPATLELGGKNPCIVAPGADLKVAARRIVWGKFTNLGQTCIAPDFLIVHDSIRDELMRQITAAIRKFYGEVPLASPDYGKLIDLQAYERLSGMCNNGRLINGGDKDPVRHAIEPTVVDRLPEDDPLLKQEIFGPILPVTTYDNDMELLEKVRECGKPLALYCFGGSRETRQMLRERTSSGALVFNDVVVHFINPDMPFGGVGGSGMGAYHGKRTFDTFTHTRPEMVRWNCFDLSFRYPPYPRWRSRLLKFFAD